MDSIGGAKILTTRLLRDSGDSASADAAPPIADDALPVFHWAGVAPAEEPQEAVAPPRPRRRWPFRSG
jgi:hypothetical protein